MPADGRLPAVEETLTIAPSPLAVMPGSAGARARTALIRLSSNDACQSSSVSSSSLRMSVPPTLLTRQSTRPNAATRPPRSARSRLAGDGQVGGDVQVADALRRDGPT